MSKERPVKGTGSRSGKIYESVILRVFDRRFKRGHTSVSFTRDDIEAAAKALDADPKNVGDLVYSYRYRKKLPAAIRSKAPKGKVWIIRGDGTAKYRFDAVAEEYAFIRPRLGLAVTKVPDGTPGVISRYALDDEQALLAKVRYNRLLDIFTGVASYSLQSHLRTQVKEIGQVETDEVYVGIDKQGAHYVFPVQAKGGSDSHSIVQIEQDFAMCRARFPRCICRSIAAQFFDGDKIALFLFDVNERGEAVILQERHYRLVPSEQISEAELEAYRRQALSL